MGNQVLADEIDGKVCLRRKLEVGMNPLETKGSFTRHSLAIAYFLHSAASELRPGEHKLRPRQRHVPSSTPDAPIIVRHNQQLNDGCCLM